MAKANVTAVFGAENRISPELKGIANEAIKTDRTIDRMASGAERSFISVERSVGRVSRSVYGMNRATERAMQRMQSDAQRMQREISQLRSEVRSLSGVHANPKVTLDDQASGQLDGLKQRLLEIGTLATGIVIGSSLAGNGDNEYYKKLGLIGAREQNPQEVERLVGESKRINQINPYLEPPQSLDIVTEAERTFGPSAQRYAQEMAKLAYTTSAFGVEESTKVMASIKGAYQLDDPTRIANVMQYIDRNAKDLRNELPDILNEYSVQYAKVFDTPEKQAMFISEASKMNVWSQDKVADAVKEATITILNNGDLTNMMKAGYEADGMKSEDATRKAEKESAQIAELIRSEDPTLNKKAIAFIMSELATVKDSITRDQLLFELSKGPGEDLAKDLAPVLKLVGDISLGNKTPIIKNEVDNAYASAKKADPLFEHQQAQVELAEAYRNFSTTIKQDATPTLKTLGDAAHVVAEKFSAMPDMARYGVAGGALVAGAAVYMWASTSQVRAAKELSRAADNLNDAAKKIGSKSDIDVNIGPDNKKPQKNNRFPWLPFRKDPNPETTKPKYLSSAEAAKQALYGTPVTGEVLPRSFGMGEKLLKGVPYAGAILGMGGMMLAENKWDSLARLGVETGGGAIGGAATGALIGSIVPGVGTAVGAILGSVAGSWGAGELYDQAKQLYSEQQKINDKQEKVAQQQATLITTRTPSESKAPIPLAFPLVPVMPPISPVPQKSGTGEKKVTISTVHVPITLKADGVLQDVNGMMSLIQRPEVRNKIVSVVGTALEDALETTGGTPPSPPRSGGGR